MRNENKGQFLFLILTNHMVPMVADYVTPLPFFKKAHLFKIFYSKKKNQQKLTSLLIKLTQQF